VEEGDLDSFLAVAEDLRIDGLVGRNVGDETEKKEIDSNSIIVGELDNKQNLKDDNVTQVEDSSLVMENRLDDLNSDEYNLEKNLPKIVLIKEDFTMDDINSSKEECNSIKDNRAAVDNVEQQKPEQINKEQPTTKHQISSKYCQNVIKKKSFNKKTRKTSEMPCPLCNTKVTDAFPLELHMRLRQERQCNECQLFFQSCQTLSVHKKGRCRGRDRI